MKGLDRYAVRVEGDALYVDFTQLIPGPERGAEEPPPAASLVLRR